MPGAVEVGDDAGEETGWVQVWDPLVRVFHWTLAAAVLGAFLIERPRDLHEALGWIALGAVGVRILWGFIGSAHARFADFVPTPGSLIRFLRDLGQGREARYLGHNPAGAAMILALLFGVTVAGVSGWMMTTDAFFAEDWVEELHEIAANGVIALVAIHVAGVLFVSLRHGENLVRAMITGRKRGES